MHESQFNQPINGGNTLEVNGVKQTTALIDGANVARYRGKDKTDIYNIKLVIDEVSRIGLTPRLVIDNSLWKDVNKKPEQKKALELLMETTKGLAYEDADPHLIEAADNCPEIAVVSRDQFQDYVKPGQHIRFYIDDFKVRAFIHLGGLIKPELNHKKPIVLYPTVTMPEILAQFPESMAPVLKSWHLVPVWVYGYAIDAEFRWYQHEKIGEVKESGFIMYGELSPLRVFFLNSSNASIDTVSSSLLEGSAAIAQQKTSQAFEELPFVHESIGASNVEKKIKGLLSDLRKQQIPVGRDNEAKDYSPDPEKEISLYKGRLYFVPLGKVIVNETDGPKARIVNGIAEVISRYDGPISSGSHTPDTAGEPAESREAS